MKQTQKRPKPKIVRTRHYNCAYVKVMAVLTRKQS